MTEMHAHRKSSARYFPLWELIRTRVFEFMREPEALFWTFGFPVLVTIGLGIAFRSMPPASPHALVTGPPAAVQELKSLLSPHPVRLSVASEEEAGRLLASGKADLQIRVRLDGDPLRLEVAYRFDPAIPEAQAARMVVDDTLQRAVGRTDPVPTALALVTALGARYVDFLIPGLLGLNIMGSGLWGVGYVLVEARSRKLLKRFAVTPMRHGDYVVSFIVSRIILLIPEMLVLLLFAYVFFDVRVHGSFAALMVTGLISSVMFSSLGILLAARPRTVESVMGWMNAVSLPMWVLSGSLFSCSRFPDAVQPFLRCLPLTASNDAMRLIMNEGTGLAGAGFPLLLMLGWTFVCFFLSLRIFRWQ